MSGSQQRLSSGSTSSSSSSPSAYSSSCDNNAFVVKTEWRSVYFVTAIVIMDAIKLSVIQSNSWPYLKSIDPVVDEEFYGIGKSAFTLGTIGASLLAGYVSNRMAHTKPAILFGILLTLFTCILYANMEVLVQQWRKWSFLLLELILGLGGGALTLWRTSLAMSSTDRDRKKATAFVSIAFNLGFIAGPIIVLFFGFVLPTALYLPWGAHLSIYTAPVYVQVLICTIGAILFTLYFNGRMHCVGSGNERWTRVSTTTSSDNEDGIITERAPLELVIPREEGTSSPMPPTSQSQPTISRELSNCAKASSAHYASASAKPDCLAIFACFVVRINFSAFILYLIALAAPYAMTVFGWNGEQTVIYGMICQGLIGIMGLIVSLGYVFRLLTRIAERHCILTALCVMLIFYLASYPWPFLTAQMPVPRYVQKFDHDNTTIILELVANGCDRDKYTWCDSTPATNVYVYHVALILCLGLAMPVGQVNLDVLYSRLLGPIKQGTMQGLFFAVGETLTLFGPPLLNYSYHAYGPKPIWIAEILFFTASIILWLFCYRRLVPPALSAKMPLQNGDMTARSAEADVATATPCVHSM